MKQVILITILLLCICVLVIQPLHLIESGESRIQLHLGKTVDITSLTEAAGGYKCYMEDGSYFWLSDGECAIKTGERLAVRFRLGRTATIFRKES